MAASAEQQLPGVIQSAISRAHMQGAEGWDLLGLWIDASWRAAQLEGMTAEEYAHWIDAGLWNLAGDPDAMTKIGIYRSVAGTDGWLLAKSGMSAEEALERFYDDGPGASAEAARVLLALEELAAGLPGDPDAERTITTAAVREPGPAQIDFS